MQDILQEKEDVLMIAVCHLLPFGIKIEAAKLAKNNCSSCVPSLQHASMAGKEAVRKGIERSLYGCKLSGNLGRTPNLICFY